MPTYRNNTTGETVALTTTQAARFFDNRDVRDWALMGDEGMELLTEPSDQERASLPDTTQAYLAGLERRVDALDEEMEALAAKLKEVETELDQMRLSRNYWANQFEAAEAALVAVYRLALGDVTDMKTASIRCLLTRTATAGGRMIFWIKRSCPSALYPPPPPKN